MRKRFQSNRRKGNTVVEFALVSVFLVPLLLGTVNVGLTLGRSIQVNQVCRDAGHMYVRQVDFSKVQNQNVIQRLGDNIGLNVSAPSSSKGVVVLSKILYMGATDCTGAGLTVGTCPNYRTPVITQRIVMGKSSLRASDFGTPNSSLITSNGDILPLNYATQTSCRATVIGNLLTMSDGDIAYIAETYFEAPEWKFPGSYELTGTYSRAIY
ncbi:MAG: pilus assembly protein [Acidobacteria bacterium]|nr:pilus assembly protein [Acidobacteriota bacterium]